MYASRSSFVAFDARARAAQETARAEIARRIEREDFARSIDGSFGVLSRAINGLVINAIAYSPVIVAGGVIGILGAIATMVF
jgi:hypothetical protein